MKPRPLRWIVVACLALLAGWLAAAWPALGAWRESLGNQTQLTANWPHFGCDSSFTANNSLESTIDVTNVAQLERLWGIGCDDGYFSVISRSPAIRDGILYTSGAGNKLTAYNARTGKQLWQFGNGNLGWAPQPVVSEGGTVFYMEGSYPTHLYAVNGQTGAQLWEAPLSFDMGFNDTALATVDEDKGLVYVVENPFSGDGELYALSKQTGAIVWYKSRATDNAGFAGDYVLLNAGKLYALADVPMSGYPDHAQHMLKIDTTTHNIDLTYERPQPEGYYDIKQYTLCNDKLIVTYDYQYNPDKLLVAYDVLSPTIAWRKTFSETTGTIACNPANNRIYVPTDPWLYALDVGDGFEVWKYTGYGPIYNPSVANGIVYFLSDTNMYAIDEDTHTQLFRYPLGYEAYETTQVAIADGMLFFSGNGGTCDLYALGFPGPKVFLPLMMRGQ